MSYTPPREESQTRYSTPEPDLDDHRNQAESLPLANEQAAGARRGTLASLASNERPRMEQLDLPQMRTYGSIARDFENAIDDDKSVKSNRSNRSNRSKRSADEEWHAERRGTGGVESPGGPIVARRSTFRRAVHNRQREAGNGSRESSRDRSSSPPNSVDAFAPPRPRGRAGTMNSKVAASVDNLSLQRTISNAQSRRRPTVGEEGTAGGRTDVGSVRSSVQEDVCFPPEDPPNTYTIDFDDLEDFVAQTHTKTPLSHPFTPQVSQQTEQTKRVFHDLRHGEGAHGLESFKKFYRSTESVDKPKEENEKVADSSSDEDLKRVVSRGAPENRFTFFSSEFDESVHAPELGGLLMPGETFQSLFELGPEGGVWWLDMLNPTEEEVFAICGAFRVHPLTREDITTQETREKVELFRSYYFVCFRSFYAVDKNSDDYLEPINVYAVVFREGLLTFSFCTNPHAANVRKRIGRLRDYVNLSADWICYALIDEIVDSFAPVLREVETETDTIEDSVFTARFEDSRAILKGIGECRKKVMSLLRLLGGKADVIRGFAKKCNEQYASAPRGDVGLYLSDVQDHVVTMMSNLGHFEKMLSRSHSNHLSQISLQHIEQGSHANGLLGKITVFATILVPLNLVAGLFGMNVNVPGKNDDGLSWWFGILGVMVAFAVMFLCVAKKMKWI
jgi:magnesium transporter